MSGGPTTRGRAPANVFLTDRRQVVGLGEPNEVSADTATGMSRNLDVDTVAGFGQEWREYDQAGATDAELVAAFNRYFAVFPWNELPAGAVGFDLGCGSGRWARHVAPRVQKLHCIDASAEALAVAETNLREIGNCEFHHASVDELPFSDASMDFAYSLGVLHHVPDTQSGIRSCVEKLKPGAPFLIYLYYAFDNRPGWYRRLWAATDVLRRRISVLPIGLKLSITRFFATVVYLPLARLSLLLERLGLNVESIPLSIYRHHSLYTMKTDALDRLGTRLEQRFSAEEIERMMRNSGLEGIRFHQGQPFWCAVGYRAALAKDIED